MEFIYGMMIMKNIGNPKKIEVLFKFPDRKFALSLKISILINVMENLQNNLKELYRSLGCQMPMFLTTP